jgi:PIN domain nuclease of toxin-antitoxin system
LRLLLDTHIWLWSALAPDKLSPPVATALESADSEIWLSPISIWELLILVEKGRIALDADPAEWVARTLATSPIREAPLTREVALQSRSIDLPHQDPADRFIAATAIVYGLTLVTADEDILLSNAVPVIPNR